MKVKELKPMMGILGSLKVVRRMVFFIIMMMIIYMIVDQIITPSIGMELFIRRMIMNPNVLIGDLYDVENTCININTVPLNTPTRMPTQIIPITI